MTPATGPIVMKALRSMESVARTIASYAKRCYASAADFDYETLSPFTILSLYQSAAVLCYLQQINSDVVEYNTEYELLLSILTNFAKRWSVAGKQILT